jgi:hypothetical protein
VTIARGGYFAFDCGALFESFLPTYKILARTLFGGGGEDIRTLFDGNPSGDTFCKSNDNASIYNLFNSAFEFGSDFNIFDSEKRLIEHALFKR